MKKLIVSHGKITYLVDDEDYPITQENGWTFDGRYIARMINGKKQYLHRVIMKAKKGDVTDHIDGNRLDNRKNNLRLCTIADNTHHALRLMRNNTSGYKGVSWSPRKKRWRAYINVKRKQIYLGVFKSAIEAAKAYDKAAKELFGEYAGTNEFMNAK